MSEVGLPVVVAIPAKNESERIEACLDALANQRDASGRGVASNSFVTALLVNNSDDDTARQARDVAGRLGLSLVCQEMDIPPEAANAGRARRLALDLAATILEDGGRRDGIILTTDADTRVRPDWLSANVAAIRQGADAVAGSIDFDPRESASFPHPLGNRHLEERYAALSAEIQARFDPRPHDPWPNHRWAWGASLAVRLDAYRRVGGVPEVPLAEDRAFVRALESIDAKVRYSLAARVWTSSRTVGRAPGGLADLIRSFAEQEDTLCDALLEPATMAIRRAIWRGRLRRAHQRGTLAGIDWARRLAIAPSQAARLPDAGPFGRFWQSVEEASPRLRRERLHPSRLAHAIAITQRVLRRVPHQPG